MIAIARDSQELQTRNRSSCIFSSLPSSDVPEAIRLRRLLKAALRSFGFRCIAIEQNSTAGASDSAADTSASVQASTPQIERNHKGGKS